MTDNQLKNKYVYGDAQKCIFLNNIASCHDYLSDACSAEGTRKLNLYTKFSLTSFTPLGTD